MCVCGRGDAKPAKTSPHRRTPFVSSNGETLRVLSRAWRVAREMGAVWCSQAA
jgi:hypothetical protein